MDGAMLMPGVGDVSYFHGHQIFARFNGVLRYDNEDGVVNAITYGLAEQDDAVCTVLLKAGSFHDVYSKPPKRSSWGGTYCSSR